MIYSVAPANDSTGTAGATISYTVNGTFYSGPVGLSEANVVLDSSMTMPITVTAYASATMMEDSDHVT